MIDIILNQKQIFKCNNAQIL